jgi:hypothetical protein
MFTLPQIVDFVLEACKRATTTGEANEEYSTVRKVFLIRDKKMIVNMIKGSKVMNTKIASALSDATGERYWTWATRISNWIMADNKGKLNFEEAVAVQRKTPVAVAHKVENPFHKVFDFLVGVEGRTFAEVESLFAQALDRKKFDLAKETKASLDVILKAKGLTLDDLKQVL